MGRPKNEKHSGDIDAQIRQLEEEKQRLILAEDQRRGAIIRECLSGKSADQLRNILRPLIAPRDAFLFRLEQPMSARAAPAVREAHEISGNAGSTVRAPIVS